MSWKIILTSIVSTCTAFAGNVTWRMSNVYGTNDTWRLEHSAPETGRVTRATVHSSPSAEFLLDWLARQYTNDMRTLHGRIKWHGKPVRQELDDTNRMCMVEYYADGTIHVDPYRKMGDFHSLTNTARWKSASEAKRQKVLEMREKAKALRAKIEAERSILPGLKDARLQTFDNKNTESNVKVNINIGGSHNGR